MATLAAEASYSSRPRPSAFALSRSGLNAILAPGRAAVAHVAGPFPGGLAWYNVYLKAGEGFSAFNLGIVDGIAKSIHGIFVFFGIVENFNMEPSVIACSGFLERVSGKVFALTEGLVRPSGRAIGTW